MKNKPWSKEEKDIVMELVEQKKFYQEISEELETNGFFRSAEAIRKMYKRNQNVDEPKASDLFDTFHPANSTFARLFPTSLQQLEADIKADIKQEKADNEFSEIELRKKEIFNFNNKKFSKLGRPSGRLIKILSLSDLHIPFENDAVIKDALENHLDADILVLNGDFLDLYSVSKWPKDKAYLLRHEYEIGMRWLQLFASKFKKVFLTRGNHDNRLHSYFMSSIDPGMSFLTHPDPLERMANGYSFTCDTNGEEKFEKIYDFDNVFYEGGVCGWYVKLGDAIFVHPSGGTKVPMKTSTNVAEYFIGRDDFTTIVSGHTHKMGKIFWKNKLIIEQGCCCVPMDYEADAKMKYSTQTFGYAVVYMNEQGQVDYELSNPVYFGTGTIIKDSIGIGD